MKNIIFKFEELGNIPGKRGGRPVNPEKVLQIDDAIATTSSGASMLQQVSARSVFRCYLFPVQLCIMCCTTFFDVNRLKLKCF